MIDGHSLLIQRLWNVWNGSRAWETVCGGNAVGKLEPGMGSPINRLAINTAHYSQGFSCLWDSTVHTSERITAVWITNMCATYVIRYSARDLTWRDIWIPNTTNRMWNMNAKSAENHLIGQTTSVSTKPSAKPFGSSVLGAIEFFGI